MKRYLSYFVPFTIIFVLSALILAYCKDLQGPDLPCDKSPRRFYSSQARLDLKNTLLKALKKPQKRVFWKVFALTDKDLIEALNKGAFVGQTRLVVDKKQVNHLKKRLLEPIQVKEVPQRGLMHQKLFVFDDVVFVGSANLTPTSLRMHDNLVIGLKDQKLSDHICSESQDPYFGEDLEFYTCPSERALCRIIELIENAHESIDVAQFTFTHPKLCNALLQAKYRGVHVRVILDRSSSFGASKQIKELLNEHGIDVVIQQGYQLMHHKMAWIDESFLIMGSANWTKSAFEKNQDDVLILLNMNPKERIWIHKLFRNLFWEGKRLNTHSR